MLSRFADLKNKEIICTKDGLRVGYVDDVAFDMDTYEITHLIAYGRYRFFGLLGRGEDIRISCKQVQVIGEDIILVDDYEQSGKRKTAKEHFLHKFFE
ncbi:Uncharacterized protein conserved in bacteria [uncultured Ruminococcus sp.]|uniref:YlmC/YmxH family sporulation protein n=1 Tax=Massiliimalia timonensis TaxID=1987501 RepID=A0A8J6NZJ1_9FIRM|nr:YlmC/YmxH family sporulation protein [Massiliimalia timonensis]MBC8610176.1 YlmC/YmxH family sporulation protein [Massiliimalia timonensis]SCH06091.1 Uncharacterized protein conserved in bacteria [uncultured Ruminococcus sp.]SCH75681.1 Uncharacterized protein conserved in bacteria [uncultured Clostridium sp.]